MVVRIGILWSKKQEWSEALSCTSSHGAIADLPACGTAG